MVLQDLGEKILSSFSKLASAKKVDDKLFKEIMFEITNALKSADVNPQTISSFFTELWSKYKSLNLPPGISPRKIIEKEIINSLVKMIDPGTQRWEPQKGTVNIIMMIGLQGSGKTTTCTKLGHFYKKRGFKVGVIAADTFRAGAREQLMQNAQQVNIPYYVDFITEDPVEVSLCGIEKFKKENFDLIIVDTSGRHMQETSLIQEMQQLEDAINPDQVIFVLDGTIGQIAYSQAKAFSDAVSVGSIIITKLDSNAKGGGAISAVAATKSPILFYGTGESASSLEVFDAKSFVSIMLGYGDPTAFARKMEEIDLDKQNEVAQRILEGHFTFREMYSVYQSVLKIGDISSFVESMGLMQLLPKEMSNESMNDNIKKILVVIDSMSDKEIDDPSLFKSEYRKKRIARGTGLPLCFVQFVIDQQKNFTKIFSKMGKSVIQSLINMENNPSQMNDRNLQKVINGVSRSMGQGMVQQMGGTRTLTKIAKNSMIAKKNKK